MGEYEVYGLFLFVCLFLIWVLIRGKVNIDFGIWGFFYILGVMLGWWGIGIIVFIGMKIISVVCFLWMVGRKECIWVSWL